MSLFKSPKNTGKGYLVPLKNPLIFKLKVHIPFGVDTESSHKWSLKMNINYLYDPDHLVFLEQLNALQKDIKTFLDREFPNTAHTYFMMEPVTISNVNTIPHNNNDEKSEADFQYSTDELLCQFRAKMNVKNGKTSTTFMGNRKGETKRILTESDIPRNGTVCATIECDSWWLLENEKTVGQNWEIKHIELC